MTLAFWIEPTPDGPIAVIQLAPADLDRLASLVGSRRRDRSLAGTLREVANTTRTTSTLLTADPAIPVPKGLSAADLNPDPT